MSCHPDKNPDNPKAVELFHQLSEALAVLTDEKAKKAYDNLLKAKKANELRNRQLDAKRQKLKSDLEAREKAAFEKKTDALFEERKFKAEVERLQKEGKRQLEEEQERLREEIAKEKQFGFQTFEADAPKKLKLRWKNSGSTNYDSESLRRIFCKYGDVGEIVVMQKEKGKFSALVEMLSGKSAELAANIEKGFNENPFKKVEIIEEASGKKPKSDCTSSVPSGLASGPSNFDDFESLVMRQMRQAEERKKLIEEMQKQDLQES